MNQNNALLNRFLSNYNHRDVSSFESELNPEGILEGYLEHRGIEDYELVESDFPYHAALGSNSEVEGDAVTITHFTYLSDNGQVHRGIGNLNTVNDTSEFIEEFIPEKSVFEVAGASIGNGYSLTSPNNQGFNPDNVYCFVFYDLPDADPIEAGNRLDFDSQLHKLSALESLKDRSLATGFIASNREHSALQIDYWSRVLDKIIEDYRDLNWDNPGEF